MTTDRHFRELRLRLVEISKELRSYRGDKDNPGLITISRSHAEQRAIQSANGKYGSNPEERARFLTLALAEDKTYQITLTNLRNFEYEHERVEQLIEAAKDERRAAEWQIRAKLADGLFRQQVQSDSSDPLGDGAFDDTMDGAWVNIEDGLTYSRSGPYRPSEDLPF